MNKSDINFTKPSQQQLNILLEHLRSGRYVDAEKLSLFITQEFPNHQFAWKVLAVILNQTGKINRALIASKKSIELEPQDNEGHFNLAIILQKLGKLNEAETSYRKVITLKPDHAEAYCNLGIILQKHGKFNEAEISYRRTITLKPDHAGAYSNLGITLTALRKLEEAETNYRKAIELKPRYAEAYNNLGITLKELRKLEDAETNYRKAIELKPRYAEAYCNLGITLKELRKLEDAETNYRKAIELKPDYIEAYNNLANLLKDRGDILTALNYYKKVLELDQNYAPTWINIFQPLQIIKSQKLSNDSDSFFFDTYKGSEYTQVSKSILKHRLNKGDLSANSSLKEVLNIISTTENNFIKNPNFLSTELSKPTLPKKITALFHFGRSGTGLLHSLIDAHPEISTLPSVYFSEFFDYFTWKKIIAGGWEDMANRFTTIYDVLFDASSSTPIPDGYNKFISYMGKKEGLTTVGKDKNETLSVDKKIFIKELKQLMSFYDRLDAITFFKLIHSSYEITLRNPYEKKHIFYHIHNPEDYAKLNFLSLTPSANLLMMVREPLQNCESWIKKSFYENNYKKVASRIFTMLFDIDNSIFQDKNSIGVRLEDLKENPKKTMQALCGWLDIIENDSLYEMTAQGKKWWGDPTSKDYEKEGSSPFGKISINRKIGSVFSDNDQFILSTLFYPFRVRFNYAKENLEQFKKDLLSIKPMLNEMFDFEKKIAQQTKISPEKFIKSGSYLYLRSGMIERWNTLNKFNTYPNMLTPLKIN